MNLDYEWGTRLIWGAREKASNETFFARDLSSGIGISSLA